MPKIKDYLQPVKAFITKDLGLNVITTALIPVAVQTIAVASPDAASALASALDPSTMSVISHGGAAGITAGIMALLHIIMTFISAKKAK